jgi:outer membrane protein assembly factor BamB
VLVIVGWSGIAVAQASGAWPQYQGGAGHPGSAPDGPAPAYGVRWTHPEALSGPEGVSGLSAPIIADDLVVAVGVRDVVAVGLTDGDERWRLARRPGPPVPPAVGTARGRSILVYTEGYGPNPPGASASPSTSSPASSSITPTSSGSPSAGSDLHTSIVGIDLDDHKELWRTDLPSASRSGVTILDGTAYAGTNDGSVTAVDLASGEVRWTAQVGGPIDSPLAAGVGLVLCPVRGETGTAFSIAALHDADGSEAWRFQPDSASTVGGSPAILGETG